MNEDKKKTKNERVFSGLLSYALLLSTCHLLYRCHDGDKTDRIMTKVDEILVNQVESKKEDEKLKEQIAIIEGYVQQWLHMKDK